MAHRTNIPENFKKKDELANMLDDILSAIVIDAIFLSRKQREGESEYHILTLFIDNDPVPNEIVALVSKYGKEHPDFRLRVYTQEQSEIGLSRGSLYFLEHCCLGVMVYARLGGGNFLDWPEMPLDQIITRTERYHGCEMKKVGTFTDTADMLIKEGDLAIATFNMHQAFELAFRFIEQMCIGHSRVTHSIIGHIKYCGRYLPTLVPFTRTSDMDNNELLLLLEHAYSVARYGNEFEITTAQAEAIQLELRGFIEELGAIYRRRYNCCRDRIESVRNGIGTTLQKEAKSEGRTVGTSLFGQLKELEKMHFHALKPYIPEKGLHSLELITEGYYETSFIISDLIKVCITALENENFSTRNVPQPHINISGVLGYILDLIPHDEMEFLDKVKKLLSKEPSKDGPENNSQ